MLPPPPIIYCNNTTLLDFRLLKAILIALVLLLPALPAFANDINVGSGCSLAQAINEANEATSGTGSCAAGDNGSGDAGADKIILSGKATLFDQLPTITSHVTISGGGNTINLNLFSNIVTSADSNLTLENITLEDGGNRLGSSKVTLELGGSATLNQVHIEGSQLSGIHAKGNNATYTFSNIVFQGSGAPWNLPSALYIENGQATVSNLGIGSMQSAGPMIRVDSGAQLTLTGCKSIGRVLNPAITGDGTISDNSSGACSGAIGNGAEVTLVPVENPPPASACGLPRPTTGDWVNVPDDAGTLEYVLTSDCEMNNRTLYIPSGVKMRISSEAGEKHTITAVANFQLFVSAGDLTLKNVELVGAAGDVDLPVSFLSVSAPGTLVMEDSTIRSADGTTAGRSAVDLNAAEATFERVAFNNLRGFSTWKPSGLSVVGPSKVTIRDSTFTGNEGGPAVINIPADEGASVRMLGTNTFSGSVPKDIHDPHSAVCEGAACPADNADINVDATCSLANAIRSANGDEQVSPMDDCEAGIEGVGAAGADKIVLSATTSVSAQLPEIRTHVMINGGDTVSSVRIDLSKKSAIETSADSHLTLENIFINQGGVSGVDKAALELGGPATLTQVYVQNSHRLGIRTKGEGAVYSFSNMIIIGTTGTWNFPSALWLEKGQVTLTDVGFSSLGGGAAMIAVGSGAQLTFEGCKTVSRVLNREIIGSGAITERSSGECSGQIANGRSIPNVPVENPPPAYACGFPKPALAWVNVPDNAGLLSYELTDNCVLDTSIHIPSGVSMKISSPAGQRYTITAAANNSVIETAGELTLVNVDLAGPADGATVARAGIYLFSVEASFTNVTFRNLRSHYSWLATAIFAVGRSKITIRDSTFRDNSGGPGAISSFHNLDGYVRLLGTNTFSGNTPEDIYDPHGLVCRGAACFPPPIAAPTATPTAAPSAAPTAMPTATPKPATCPSAPGGPGRFGWIGSADWRGHFARLAIQAQDAGRQAAWAAGDASVSGINSCFWDYECSTNAHWAYGHYHAVHGHVYMAPGSRPPAAVGRSDDGKFNLCYSVWNNGCNSAEAWEFGWESGKQIFDRYLYQRHVAPTGCESE